VQEICAREKRSVRQVNKSNPLKIRPSACAAVSAPKPHDDSANF
jgi:hypothetical protein